ncbi:hypothetical protein EAY71_25950, partial [Vibrio anguillarum]|nr:hypothetical protein [Vibrio anguillarum]
LRIERGSHLSTATLHKVLSEASVKPIVTYRRRKDFQRYERPIPGDRVQMDTCKIAPGVYQYTAIDDCSRYRVSLNVAIFSSSKNCSIP